MFPLALGGRYLRTAAGGPFLVVGDSPWLIEVQLTTGQIDTYLTDRAARDFNSILFECMEHYDSSQSPEYRNVNGDDPFTTMSPVSWTSRVTAYWNHIDYIVNSAKTRGMACFITPAYAGFEGGSQGWQSDITAASDADLQNYGAFLAARYTQGNVVWVMGGDYAGDTTQRAKQWNIAIGIRSINPASIICGHQARIDSDGYTYWGAGGSNFTGWNLNTVYTDKTGVVAEAATAYGRAGPIPAVGIEFSYEQSGTTTASEAAYQAIQCILSGIFGYFFGNTPLYGLGQPSQSAGDAAAVLAAYLNTAGAQAITYIARLLNPRSWWLLQPKTDTSVVTTALGTGLSATVPARASDGSFALIGKNNASSITVDKTCITHTPFTARWYDPMNGTYTTPGEGLSHTNTGTQAFAHPGNNSAGTTPWVLVLE